MAKKGKDALKDRLLAFREGHELTNKQAADYFGVSLRTWHAWLYGQRNPPGTARILLEFYEGRRKAL